MTWGLMPAERDLVTWPRGSTGIQAGEDSRVSLPLRRVLRGQSAQAEDTGSRIRLGKEGVGWGLTRVPRNANRNRTGGAWRF